MVSSVSSSRFSLMIFGSGITRSANFITESSKVAENSSIWQFLLSSLNNSKGSDQTRFFLLFSTPDFSEKNPPVDSDALVPMALHSDHHISLVQHKHCDLLWVNKFVLGAPVKDCARCSDHNLLLQLDASLHWKAPTVTTNGWLNTTKFRQTPQIWPFKHT